MMNFIKNKLRSWLYKDTGVKLGVNTYYSIVQRGQFKFDNYRLDFYDPEAKRRYVIRPVGNPLPHIIDELVKITGDLKTAADIYSKFTRASAAVTKNKDTAFKVKVLIDN